MGQFLAFGAGFVSGWLVRSAVASTREGAVMALGFAMEAVRRAQRAAAMEREYLEDWVAEARAWARQRHAVGVGTPGRATSTAGAS
jgi:hypothetical protein